MEIKEINKIILDTSFKHGLSHLSSCLTAAPIVKEIYETKQENDRFVLSSGHAGIGLYAVIEAYYREARPGTGGNPFCEQIFLHHGIHPTRCADCHLDCSTGSLGQGLPIACGMALACPDLNVYCLISDGECAEGSIWEALRIKSEQQLNNLHVYANLNGHTAYRHTDRVDLANRLKAFDPQIDVRFTDNPNLGFLRGVAGHYCVLNKDQYKEALEKLT